MESSYEYRSYMLGRQNRKILMLLLVLVELLNDTRICNQDTVAPHSQEEWSQMIATHRLRVATITPTTPQNWLLNPTQGLWARRTTHRLNKNHSRNPPNAKRTEVPHSSTRQAPSRLKPLSSLLYPVRSSTRI